MAVHDIIQSGVQLKKKKWSGPVECATCDKIETSDHILSQCPVAVFMWAFLRDSFGWQSSPANCSKFFVEFVDRCRGKRQQVLIFICAGAPFGQFGRLEMMWRLTRRCCRLHWWSFTRPWCWSSPGVQCWRRSYNLLQTRWSTWWLLRRKWWHLMRTERKCSGDRGWR